MVEARSTDGRGPVPEEETRIVPVRRLVQWMYCNRLGILEWVHGEFEANRYTVEGSHIHRRVDWPGATLERLSERAAAHLDGREDADDPNELDVPSLVTRSLYLESESEGLVARMDLVEMAADGTGTVMPVETKRGRPPRPDQAEGGVWEEDRIQVCAQALILRDHGYRCDKAVVYYASVRKRVEIAIDDALIGATREALRDFVATAESGVLPPPLEHSMKCRGCSLAGICLPDETILLRSGEADDAEAFGVDEVDEDVLDRTCDDDGPVDEDELTGLPVVDDGSDEPAGEGRELKAEKDRRVRILVADAHRKPLYITDSAARLGIEKGLLVVKKTEGDATVVLGKVRIRDTSHIAVFGRAQVSTMALREAMDRGIPVSWFTFGGYFAGGATGAPHKNVVLREAQWRGAFDAERSLDIARRIVRSKIRNQRTLLRRNATGLGARSLREMADLAVRAKEAESVELLLGLEGAAAAVYFREFPRMLKPRDAESELTFDFERRNRRPPRDPVNALLSLVYALLARECAAVAGAVGFDPMMGFHHRPRYGKPALALDLMEEMRPLIADSVVVTLINQGEVGRTDFVTRADGCNLTDGGRRAVLRAYERRMQHEVTHPIFGYRASWRRILEVQARLLGKFLLGEIPAYPPMETR